MPSFDTEIEPVNFIAPRLTTRSNHANSFDFMRFLGASLVIYGHAYPLSNRGTVDHLQMWSGGVFPTAHMGVAIFFVVSGYLIAQSLTTSPSVKNFLWKRCLRIFPGLIIATLVTVFVIGPIITTLPIKDYIFNKETLKYIQSIKLYPPYPSNLPGVFDSLSDKTVNGSLWTLPFEFTFYILLLTASLIFKNLRWILLLGFISLWASFFFWFDILQTSSSKLPLLHLRLFNLFDFALYFLSGSTAYFFKDIIHFKGYIAITLLLLWISSYLLTNVYPYPPLSSIMWVRYIVLPYLVLYLSNIKGSLNYFGRHGDISYGLYIYAFPIQQVIIATFGQATPILYIVILSFLLTIPIAWMSWIWVEKPALKFKYFVM
jgi:peptidoglycan/LPS O-acetylase OafA/YrhL